MNSLDQKLDELDHPCKHTCSGWKQGFEKGVESKLLNEEIKPSEPVITDTMRLEWMIDNSAMISKSRNIFYCEVIGDGKVRSYGEPTPREAIDAAIAKSGRG